MTKVKARNVANGPRIARIASMEAITVRQLCEIGDSAAMRTVDRAQRRWREILPQLGIESRFLSNKQGPCPLCGGKTRFRFDDKDGNGTWICNYCGAGAGLHLAMKVNRWDYATACTLVDQVIGRDQPIPSRPPAAPREGTRARLRIEGIIRAANDPNIVIEYLLSRGLSITSPVLLGHPACEYWQDKVLIGRYPAVIAPLIGPGGQLQSVHRTYCADVEPRKKTATPVTTINGASIRLFELEDGLLGIAEGIETAIACRELFRCPMWSVLTSPNGIQSFEPPSSINRLIIFSDNDKNYVGQAAAYALAKRVVKKIDVEVRIPPVPDSDWLDFLNGRTR